MATKLSIYNHKGGVGKTTLTVNIATALAEMGHRVLLVDSDPQCNLTAHLVESAVVDDLLDQSDTDTGSTVWSAIKPVYAGTGDIRPVKLIELPKKNMYLLPGDILLSLYENELSEFWRSCFSRNPRGIRGVTAISELVNGYITQEKFDFVFYDTGPNIGPLNRCILLDCDRFIVPAACDLFSIRGLKTLGRKPRVLDYRLGNNFASDSIAVVRTSRQACIPRLHPTAISRVRRHNVSRTHAPPDYL